jgi:hypothetical protein
LEPAAEFKFQSKQDYTSHWVVAIAGGKIASSCSRKTAARQRWGEPPLADPQKNTDKNDFLKKHKPTNL